LTSAFFRSIPVRGMHVWPMPMFLRAGSHPGADLRAIWLSSMVGPSNGTLPTRVQILVLAFFGIVQDLSTLCVM
jgi:hypothetical protein